MSSQAQVSATISAATKERLDSFTEQRGMKKNFVVEQALLFYMEARRELPDEAFIPTRLLLNDPSFDQLADVIESPAAPTSTLRDLMNDTPR